jgi:hypothetical protein
MKRIKMMMLLGSVASTLTVGCATTASSAPTEARVNGCYYQSLGNPSAEVARGNATLAGFAPGVRNPRADVARGNARDQGPAGRVINASDPEIARGNRSADCSISLAQASR